MLSHAQYVDLARSCSWQARLASTPQVAEALRTMAREYQEQAAKLDGGKLPKIGEDQPYAER